MFLHTAILKRLRQAPQSLADLQADAHVSLPTLRKAVQDLTDARWIRIVGQAETNGGRPPSLYGLDLDYFVIIGVHLQLPGVHLVTTNLGGQMIHEKQVIHDESPQPNEVLATIADYVFEVLTTLSDRRILGIGIAAPGFIDPPSGDILMIGRVPGWENFPICTQLNGLLNLPIRIANDIDCMALAEIQGRGIPSDQNLVYLGFDEGVKASLFLNGALYKGAMGNAGLIVGGLLHVANSESVDDPDAVLSIHGVNHLFAQRVATVNRHIQEPYRVIGAIADPRRRFESILTSASEEYPICLSVARLMNQVVGATAANLINILQPHVFVLGGMLSVMPPSMFADLETQIRSHLSTMISNNVMIRLGTPASTHTAASGAAHHFLERYLIDVQQDLLDLSL